MAAILRRGIHTMEKSIPCAKSIALPEPVSFLIQSGFFLLSSAVVLYLLLAAAYPPVHDTLHHFRHSLAIVPCH
ncbi:MAG: hypothetical protein ACREP8_02160 [Candidatus Binatia bacterium]